MAVRLEMRDFTRKALDLLIAWPSHDESHRMEGTGEIGGIDDFGGIGRREGESIFAAAFAAAYGCRHRFP
jgi:hypothetical protein